jgi:mannose-1-phosphate guanylyltransferase/mannose-6-phosphate isomerase
MIVPVILSGGAGSRLWPLSRALYPKQLLALLGEATLLQETAARLRAEPDVSEPMVICNEDHRFLVAEQLRNCGCQAATVVLEPAARSTAPAVAAAALVAIEAGDGADPTLAVMPADHAIGNLDRLRAAMRVAVAQAEAGRLAIFGIVPTGPETGFGYIHAPGWSAIADAGRVEKFVEKPDLPDAERYVASGDYLWNSGIFVFRASRYLEELTRFAPEMVDACRRAVAAAVREKDFVRLDADAFAEAPSDSVDYAVMEKTEDAVVVPLDAGWTDIGSWDALYEASSKDGAGNVRVGDVVALDCEGSFLHSSGRLVAALGLRDLVVVDTPDAVLVAPRDQSQGVKALVDALKDDSRGEATQHRRVARPWGSYDSIDSGERFQVKRLIINPGAVLSLQKHQRRAEHWVVVRGRARVTLDHEVFTLEENQSTYIPIGAVHRVENPGDQPLHIIEVQSGDYLGEDDILRLEDKYGRKGTVD